MFHVAKNGADVIKLDVILRMHFHGIASESSKLPSAMHVAAVTCRPAALNI